MSHLANNATSVSAKSSQTSDKVVLFLLAVIICGLVSKGFTSSGGTEMDKIFSSALSGKAK